VDWMNQLKQIGFFLFTAWVMGAITYILAMVIYKWAGNFENADFKFYGKLFVIGLVATYFIFYFERPSINFFR
jgi:multisubunit Na+/H+ antiporter MnhB subunit